MELFIMFVYDTQCCQKEEDDPQDAVLYFHPTWVSDQQRLALCGQLMGATQFFLSAFSCPRILALNSGKFVVRQFGRYILTVGTDRNIPDWILEHRADSLHHLVQFYHRDFTTISTIAGSDGNQFVEKLNQIFETYVPVIQFAGNVFGNIPAIRLPKSASNVFLEAIQILHCCQEKRGVLGGTVLYQNKVVATQLSCDLTKRLVNTDPYRIKSPAENVATPFHLPVGVQLLYVYVENQEYNKLIHNSAKARSAFEGVSARKLVPRKALPGKMTPVKEQMSMKRDTSRIFTVPEEKEGETDVAEDNNVHQTTKSGTNVYSECAPKTLRELKGRSISECPTPLREITDRFISECPTPLKDINLSKILHAKVLSICRGSEGDMKRSSTDSNLKKTKSSVPDIVKYAAKVKSRTEKLKSSKSIRNFLVNYCEKEVHSLSLNDLHYTGRRASKHIPLRGYSFGLPRLTHDMCEEDENSPTEKTVPGRRYYNTISDPIYPYFRNDGLPISRPLFDEYLAHHFQLLDMERSTDSSPSDRIGSVSSVLSERVQNDKGENEGDVSLKVSSKEEKDPSNKDEEKLKPSSCVSSDKNATSAKQEMYRRSLSLPLKTLTTKEYEEDEMRTRSTSYTAGVLESPSVRMKTLGGLQLTPLMSKLSLLAMEEKTSGFCSRETTPSEFRDFGFPGTSEDSSVSRSTRPEERREQEAKSEGNGVQKSPEKAVLYVCGQQNMALLLLLEEGLGQDPEIIHSLWETSLNGLSRLETHLRQCLEHFPQTDGGEPYSYLCMDPSWDMLQRGGPWGALELDVVSSLHHDFTKSASLTEIVVRCEDSTVYGYQCGKTEVFYQQPAGSTTGLPTPSDLMGIVPLKARRRLERDHGIILL